MRKIIFLFMLSFFAAACSPQKMKDKKEENTEIKPSKNEEGEWDLQVIDAQFDYFLNAIAKRKSQYTESYLKTKNRFLVSEWNSYYYSGRYRDVIESSIDYDPNENYGLNFEYKLYQVFAFVSWKYHLKMTNLSSADAY